MNTEHYEIKNHRRFKHSILMSMQDMKGHNIWYLRQWCHRVFGPRWATIDWGDELYSEDGVWNVLYSGNERGYRWYFMDPGDLVMFTLKWA